jgi:hypothetical protein
MTTAGPTCIIVDTNVLAVAEGLHGQASETCVAACLSIARRLQDGATIAVDDGDRILKEYIDALRGSTNAGIGSKLASALYRRRFDPNVCRLLSLTPIDEPPGSFEEVPEPLRDFDNDDQKFIAVAVAEGSRSPVFTAVDREWWDRQEDLSRNGINVQHLCAAEFLDQE